MTDQSARLPSIIGDRYQIKKEIGRGTYGIVFTGVDRHTQKPVAIKYMQDAARSQEDLNSQREIKSMLHVTDPCIVELYDAIFVPRVGSFLILELMECDLLTFLRKYQKNRQMVPEEVVSRIMHRVFAALARVHEEGYVHRDLKPENILIKHQSADAASCEAKICDFGLVRDMRLSRPLTDYIATRWYRAPEMLLGGQYGSAVDLWAAGCIMIEVLQSRPLFEGENNTETLSHIVERLGGFQRPYTGQIGGGPWDAGVQLLQKQPQLVTVYKRALAAFVRPGRKRGLLDSVRRDLSPSALDLLSRLLTHDPSRRITAAEALRHPFCLAGRTPLPRAPMPAARPHLPPIAQSLSNTHHHAQSVAAVPGYGRPAQHAGFSRHDLPPRAERLPSDQFHADASIGSARLPVRDSSFARSVDVSAAATAPPRSFDERLALIRARNRELSAQLPVVQRAAAAADAPRAPETVAAAPVDAGRITRMDPLARSEASSGLRVVDRLARSRTSPPAPVAASNPSVGSSRVARCAAELLSAAVHEPVSAAASARSRLSASVEDCKAFRRSTVSLLAVSQPAFAASPLPSAAATPLLAGSPATHAASPIPRSLNASRNVSPRFTAPSPRADGSRVAASLTHAPRTVASSAAQLAVPRYTDGKHRPLHRGSDVSTALPHSHPVSRGSGVSPASVASRRAHAAPSPAHLRARLTRRSPAAERASPARSRLHDPSPQPGGGRRVVLTTCAHAHDSLRDSLETAIQLSRVRGTVRLPALE